MTAMEFEVDRVILSDREGSRTNPSLRDPSLSLRMTG